MTGTTDMTTGRRERVALVTGAGHGIGAEVARQLAELGWTVWVAARGDKAWRVTQAFLPLLRDSPSARLVNVSSGGGSHGGGFFRDGRPLPW